MKVDVEGMGRGSSFLQARLLLQCGAMKSGELLASYNSSSLWC